MNMNRKHLGISAAVVAVLVSAWGVAIAQAPAIEPELAIADVIGKLESLGYTAISDIEKDDGAWEVDATSPAGVRVELDVDRKDGRILNERADDDDDKDD